MHRTAIEFPLHFNRYYLLADNCDLYLFDIDVRKRIECHAFDERMA